MLFADSMILYTVDLMRSKKSKIINKLSTFAGQRVTIQETAVFLYTSTEQPESEIKKTVLFTVVSKRIKLTIDKIWNIHTWSI